MRDKYLSLETAHPSLSGLPLPLPDPHLGTNWISFRGLHAYQRSAGNVQPLGAWTAPQGL